MLVQAFGLAVPTVAVFESIILQQILAAGDGGCAFEYRRGNNSEDPF